MPPTNPGKKEPGTVGRDHPTIITRHDGKKETLIPVVSIIVSNEGAVDIMVYKIGGNNVEAKIGKQEEEDTISAAK